MEEQSFVALKKKVSSAALKHIKDGQIIGIGSGSTVAIFISLLSEFISKNKFDIIAIPTSFQAKMLLIDKKIKVGSLLEYPEIDVTIDGADKVDKKLQIIKGGGAALTREKIIASASKEYVIIVDHSKVIPSLQGVPLTIPIEVLPIATTLVINKIKKMGGKPIVRQGLKKVGPIVTDNGNFILDIEITTEDLSDLNNRLLHIPGVIETGIFLNYANIVYVGYPNRIEILRK